MLRNPTPPFVHIYPDDHPQSRATIDANVYPVSALPDFRVWLQTEYAMEKFPAYLGDKVRKGVLPPSVAELIISSAQPIALPAAEVPAQLGPKKK